MLWRKLKTIQEKVTMTKFFGHVVSVAYQSRLGFEGKII